jgi:hypothetical protein
VGRNRAGVAGVVMLTKSIGGTSFYASVAEHVRRRRQQMRDPLYRE